MPKYSMAPTALVHSPDMQILLGGRGYRGHLLWVVAGVVVAGVVEVSSSTLAVVDNAVAGTAAAEAVGNAVGTAAEGVADIDLAELAPAAAAAAPLAPYDARVHSTHHLGHVAAQINPLTIFDAPSARSPRLLATEPLDSQLQLRPHVDHSGE